MCLILAGETILLKATRTVIYLNVSPVQINLFLSHIAL